MPELEGMHGEEFSALISIISPLNLRRIPSSFFHLKNKLQDQNDPLKQAQMTRQREAPALPHPENSVSMPMPRGCSKISIESTEENSPWIHCCSNMFAWIFGNVTCPLPSHLNRVLMTIPPSQRRSLSPSFLVPACG